VQQSSHHRHTAGRRSERIRVVCVHDSLSPRLNRSRSVRVARHCRPSRQTDISVGPTRKEWSDVRNGLKLFWPFTVTVKYPEEAPIGTTHQCRCRSRPERQHWFRLEKRCCCFGVAPKFVPWMRTESPKLAVLGEELRDRKGSSFLARRTPRYKTLKVSSDSCIQW